MSIVQMRSCVSSYHKCHSKHISSDENGKIDSVAVVRGVNELYDSEAIRVVKIIPEWNVIYRHGKITNEMKWSIPVKFDLNQKND